MAEVRKVSLPVKGDEGLRLRQLITNFNLLVDELGGGTGLIVDWDDIIDTPTTAAGYGLTDVVLNNVVYNNPSWIGSLDWSKITGEPTTLAGYGITDAQPLDSDLTAIAALTGSGLARRISDGNWTLDTSTYLTGNQTITLSGDVGGTGATAITTTIATNAVTYAKFQQASVGNVVLARASATAGNYSEVAIGASQLLGRGATGNITAITLGTGLSMSGTTLNATAASGDVVGPASATDNAVVRFDLTTGKLIQNSAVTIADTGAMTIAAGSANPAFQVTSTGVTQARIRYSASQYLDIQVGSDGQTQYNIVGTNPHHNFQDRVSISLSGGTTSALLSTKTIDDLSSVNGNSFNTQVSTTTVGTITNVFGAGSLARTFSGTVATITNLIGFRSELLQTGSGVVTNGIGIDIVLSGTYGTLYGIKVAAVTGGATNYAIYTDAGLVRFGDTVNIATNNGLQIQGNKVIGIRKTGWSVPTGTFTRTTFDTTTVTLPELAERVAALLNDIHSGGASSTHALLTT